MADCFNTIIGLSDRDCDCFTTGRPESGTDSVLSTETWVHQTNVCPDIPADPFTITTTYNLPDDTSPLHLQVFGSGVLLAVGVDFTVSGAKEITISDPVPGARYQTLYYAQVPVTVTTPAYSKSDSGLYITDLVPEEEIKGIESCDQTIWSMMEKARQIAIKEFQAALNARIMERRGRGPYYNKKFHTFNGYMGEPKGTSYMSSGQVYSGVRLRTNPIKSGYLHIKGILAMFQATGTVNVTIYDHHGDVVHPTFPINTVAGKKSKNEVNIKLPLLDEFEREQDYFIVYEYDSNNKPLLNKTYCGCDKSVHISRSTVEPIFPKRRDSYAWHNYLIAGGWTGDDLVSFDDAPDTVQEYMNGLCLEIEVGCDVAKGLCALAGSDNPFGDSIATAIQRKAAAWLMQKRVSGSAPKRNNYANIDQIKADISIWEGDFAEIVNYLALNLPTQANDCLECEGRTSLQSILT